MDTLLARSWLGGWWCMVGGMAGLKPAVAMCTVVLILSVHHPVVLPVLAFLLGCCKPPIHSGHSLSGRQGKRQGSLVCFMSARHSSIPSLGVGFPAPTYTSSASSCSHQDPSRIAGLELSAARPSRKPLGWVALSRRRVATLAWQLPTQAD